jgi:hypothetical protein
MTEVIMHDITQTQPAFWFAHKSSPKFAIAWVLPSHDGTFCVTGRDGQCYDSFIAIGDAITCAHLIADDQPLDDDLVELGRPDEDDFDRYIAGDR